MSDDLVKALRSMARAEHDDLSLGDEAADEIERLRQRVAKPESTNIKAAPDSEGGWSIRVGGENPTILFVDEDEVRVMEHPTDNDKRRVKVLRRNDLILREKPEDTNWLTCQGNEMPPELAPAQIVVRRSEDGAFGITCRADADAWHPGDQYRPARDADGNYMVSRKGLEPYTQYVATDQDGDVGQYAREPFTIESVGRWKNIRASSWAFAPDTHKIPGDWRDSLASVWDGEG